VLGAGSLLRHGPPAEAMEMALLSDIYGIALGRSFGIDAA
jgi:iron complex transport system ATP-binding protein